MNFRWIDGLHADGMCHFGHGFLTHYNSPCALVELCAEGSDTFMQEDAEVFGAEWRFSKDCCHAELFNRNESCIATLYLRWDSEFSSEHDRVDVIDDSFPNASFEWEN